jgi:hypothetical protein
LSDKQSSEVTELQWKRARLIYRAWLFHQPGFDELVRFYLAKSECGRFAVLLLASDYMAAGERQEIAWAESVNVGSKEVAKELLKCLWEDEKTHNHADSPAFHEIISSKSAVLAPSEVRELAHLVWPPNVR